MRIGALYDIHGNLPALEAVLRDVAEAFDRVRRRSGGGPGRALSAASRGR